MNRIVNCPRRRASVADSRLRGNFRTHGLLMIMALLLTLSVTACGYKGKLRLPEEDRQEQGQ